MSQVVGNVSIELSIDRSAYDASIERLKKEKLTQLVIKTSLDTSGINKQLEAFKAVSDLRLGIALDTRAADRQLEIFTRSRSIKTTIDLDSVSANRAIDNLLKPRSMKVVLDVDTTQLANSVRAFSRVADLR